jgi:hypothetical protein
MRDPSDVAWVAGNVHVVERAANAGILRGQFVAGEEDKQGQSEVSRHVRFSTVDHADPLTLVRRSA